LAATSAKLANYVGGRGGKLTWRQYAPNWKITMALDNQISVITPSPGTLTHGSNSVPSHLCTDDLTEISNKRAKRKLKQPDTELIFNSVCHLLTEKEQQVLYLSLGIGMEGKMSNYEIADRLGCVVSNVRETLNRSLDRIKTLVDKGSINPKRFL
jgi:DNA-directed RNA polymerase sigma subunit (sigma70/sigma32)